MKLQALLWRYRRDTRGSAAVEFALWLVGLAVPTFAAVDVGFYAFESLQVHNAAQMAAQAAWAACSASAKWPATANCGATGASLNAAIAAGEHSSSLGSQVKMTSGSEKFWCVTGTGSSYVLSEPAGVTDGVIATSSGDVNAAGGDTAGTAAGRTCTVGTSTTATPGDYIVVTVSYTYHPVFKGVSVMTLLGGSTPVISATAWTRID